MKNTIESMGLRPVNCVFIDDNKMNINEVSEFCDGIFTYHPDDIISKIDKLDCFSGKDDNDLSRLKQYKTLEIKYTEKENGELSNIDFLKKSEIEIYFDFDYTQNINRIFELLERTNQLNYTKNRLHTERKKESFLRVMEHYQSSSALIYCKDKYGDYGSVGFYLMRTTTDNGRFLDHFVFSCRTMNMGVENFVYDYLKRPRINIQEPVAYTLEHYSNVDWINVTQNYHEINENDGRLIQDKVVTVGPCHLMQMTNFLSNSIDFVHYQNGNNLIKFDCPGFFLNEKDMVLNSYVLDSGEYWSKEEFILFHKELETAKKIVLSLDDLLLDYKLIEVDGLILRGETKSDDSADYFDINKKVELIDLCIKKVADETPADCKIYILDSVFNVGTERVLRDRRMAFSKYLSSIEHEKVNIINMNALLNESNFNDGIHLDRSGYYKLSKIISGDVCDISDISEFDYAVFTEQPSDQEVALRYIKNKFKSTVRHNSIMFYCVQWIFRKWKCH